MAVGGRAVGGTGGRWRRLSVLVLALASCSHRDKIIVGAKNFTESDLLAEIAAQQIERRTGLPVERKLHLGGTFVCHEAILAGQIDLYIEYTGTAYTAVLKHAPGPSADSITRAVTDEYRSRWGLVWLPSFGFDNTFAVAVRQADAQRLGLHAISDLARVAPTWKAGFGYEFLNREDGFPGLARTYGLRFSTPPTAMDLGLTYRALADGKIDVIAGNSTDGQLDALHLVALADDRHYFPPYEAAPVVRGALLQRHPEVERALAELAGKIDDASMRQLNAQADIEHRDLRAIAHDWLERTLP